MLLTANDVKVKIGNFEVVKGVSLDVKPGEVLGLLGANGSGKTTFIRGMLGLAPSTGQVLLGGEPMSTAVAYKIGYLPEERGLYRKEKVLPVLSFFAEIKGMTKAAAKDWATEYLARVGLADKAQTKLGKLSGGQQQKVQLGVALAGAPELLVLDEPTKGLDPLNKNLLLEFVAERRAAGAGVILVSHNLDEVERLCERVVIIRAGKVVEAGELAKVKARQGEGLPTDASLDLIFAKLYAAETSTKVTEEQK